MPRVAFTPNLRRHVECPPVEVAGATAAAVLAEVFASNPRLRGYVLDERGTVRRHVALFVDGAALQPKTDLDRALRDDAELYVMQALSGG